MVQKAILAGGCFWCMIKPFDTWEGVIRMTSGYTGGHVENPCYEDVKKGITGHREAVEIIFEDEKMSYKSLLEVFFQIIDPTDAGGQFIDRGESYTTAIYYIDEVQKKEALAMIDRINQSGQYAMPVATQVLPATTFYEAEDYHQDYYKKNPAAYAEEYRVSGREAWHKA